MDDTEVGLILASLANMPEVKAWLRSVCELNEKRRRQEMPF